MVELCAFLVLSLVFNASDVSLQISTDDCHLIFPSFLQIWGRGLDSFQISERRQKVSLLPEGVSVMECEFIIRFLRWPQFTLFVFLFC